MLEQRYLQFQFASRMTFESFIPSEENRHALLAMQELTQKLDQGILYFLYGAHGVGKTHLLHAFAERVERVSETPVISCSDSIWNKELQLAQEQWRALQEKVSSAPVLLIDDIDCLPIELKLEHQLVALFNQFLFRSRPIVMTAQRAPHLLTNLDPHLRSRCASGVTIAIEPLKHQTLIELILKLARDRGIMLPEQAVSFILTRCPRDVGSLIAIIDEIDHRSLASGRKLSFPFIVSVINELVP